MVSEVHQRLLNSLANGLEKDGVTITHLDIDGTPEYFDEKYRDLPTPTERDGHVPDLVGIKNDVRCLGDAKIEIEGDDNLESQFIAFSSRQMKNGTPIPFHIAVPENLKDEMKQKLKDIGLEEKLENGRIIIWS